MSRRRFHRRSAVCRRAGRGFTLVELMVALTIGLLMLAALVTIFESSSRAHGEFAKVVEQTQNGASAMRLVSDDLAHAGYYGEFHALPAPAGVAPDPCVIGATSLYNALAFPIQGYDAAVSSPLTCLGDNDYVPGTDILVIRRASATALSAASVPITNEVYLQVSPTAAEVQFGAGSSPVGTTLKAGGTAATIFKNDGVSAANIRKYMVRIYFIAPCNMPADGGTSCTGAADDGGNPVPTLKRLELTSIAGVTGWSIVPLVEGIQDLQIDYGIDNAPAMVNATTGWRGDGVPDVYVTGPGDTDWPNVVSANVRLLARSTQSSAGFSDRKVYDMGLAGTRAAFNDGFKRHLFASAVRLTNVGGRREIPQ